MSEFAKDKKSPRWIQFRKKFYSVFHRTPSKPQDFIWNVLDFARCSITVADADEVIKVRTLIEEQFPVICIKNSYNSSVIVKGSGYRDYKLLIEVEFDDLDFGGVTRAYPKTKLICEVQILCQAWLENKKTSSMSYKILRAQCLCDLFNDAAKYLKGKNTDTIERHTDAIEIIKNRWSNLAKAVDFSSIAADSLLLTACNEGWDVAALNMLVEDLGANINTIDQITHKTPIIQASRNGWDGLVKRLIEYKCNLESMDGENETALIWASYNGHWRCVQLLLSSEADVGWKGVPRKSAHDYAREQLQSLGSLNYKRVVKLLTGKTVNVPRKEATEEKKLRELQKAGIEGSLAQFFDEQDVLHSHISVFLSSPTAVSSLSNILQTLWFGGNIEHRNDKKTPLLWAAKYGTASTVRVLLQAGAAIDVLDTFGRGPRYYTRVFAKDKEMTRVLDEYRYPRDVIYSYL